MKLVATSIVALFASVALANPPAATHAAPAAAPTAPAAKTAPAAPAAKTATAPTATPADCTKLTGEAKMKCEEAAKPAHK